MMIKIRYDSSGGWSTVLAMYYDGIQRARITVI